jgi:oligoendopeptidase F
MPQKGKYSGAYSIGGTRGLDKYYILMNFDKTLVSVNTIIHELGHSMNSYYINKKQKVYADVSIFCAEVASICNETLLALHLLKKYQNDKNIRKEILVNTIREFFSTTTRQIIFSNFEYEAVECINKGAPLTKESIIEIYKSMIEKYEGKKIKKKGKPYEYSYSTIMRIPHFYSGNFYVYKYAIGQIVGLYVASKIFNGDEEMKKKYFDFLSSGESLSPHDTIKLLGIDLNGEEVYKVASKQIDE